MADAFTLGSNGNGIGADIVSDPSMAGDSNAGRQPGPVAQIDLTFPERSRVGRHAGR